MIIETTDASTERMRHPSIVANDSAAGSPSCWSSGVANVALSRLDESVHETGAGQRWSLAEAQARCELNPACGGVTEVLPTIKNWPECRNSHVHGAAHVQHARSSPHMRADAPERRCDDGKHHVTCTRSTACIRGAATSASR